MNNPSYQTSTRKRSCAADFRRQARNMLRNKWGIAILAGLLFTIILNIGSNFSGNIDQKDLYPMIEQLQKTGDVQRFVEEIVSYMMLPETILGLSPFATTILLLIGAFSVAAIRLFVGGPVAVGYSRFNLNLLDGNSDKEASVGALFSPFGNCYRRSVGVQTFLMLIQNGISLLATAPAWFFVMKGVVWKTMDFWTSMLLILAVGLPVILIGAVLNIIITYQYSFATYIIAEYPTVDAVDALRSSKNLMKGNKWRLFCLHISFIGWALLGAITFGVGLLAVVPYMNAANAAFYHEIARRDEAKQVEFPSINPEDYNPQ